MRVISKKRLREFWQRHANARAPLEEWYAVTRKANWQKFTDVKTTYRAADSVNQFVVFDIGGNKFRLIAFIDYEWGKLFVRAVLTHKEYGKGIWKTDDFGTIRRRRSKKGNGDETR